MSFIDDLNLEAIAIAIIGAAIKLLGNSDLMDALLQSDELDDDTKRKIRKLRDSVKKEWDSLAP